MYGLGFPKAICGLQRVMGVPIKDYIGPGSFGEFQAWFSPGFWGIFGLKAVCFR